MKKLIALLLIASLILCGCGASTPAATEATTAPTQQAPAAEATEAPTDPPKRPRSPLWSTAIP